MNNDIIKYVAYFILISTTFGHLSTKSYETLSLFIATFILVYKIYNNIVIATAVSIFLSSFYKTFINKKEGMEDHHQIINQTRNQHLGISTNNDESTSTTTPTNNSDTSSTTTNNDENGSTTNNYDPSGTYQEILEDVDENAESTYDNDITDVDDSSYSCKAHKNTSPAAVALCDAGHQKVSTDICSTGCAASQKINGFYVCCVGNCPVCGGTVSDNTDYTGGASSSYYTQTDTDGDGEEETTYISEDRWDLWAQQLRNKASLAILDISDNTDEFTTPLFWDADASGIHSELYNNEISTFNDIEVAGTSNTGVGKIKISRFRNPDECTNECNHDLFTITDVRYRLGQHYYTIAPANNYNDDNWKLASRQFDIVNKLVKYVIDNHSYADENVTSPFVGKRKTAGFSSNSQLRKRINNSKIKKETTTISNAMMSAWQAFKNEIKDN